MSAATLREIMFNRLYKQIAPLIVTMLLALIAVAALSEELPRTMAGTLAAAAARHGKYIGSLYDDCCQPVAELEPQLTTIKAQFSMITNAHFFMNRCHPEHGRYDFEAADRVAAFARANNLKMRAHTLIWYPYVPVWLTDAGRGPASPADLIRQHIATVVKRYQGQVYAWDVVNEAFEADGSLRKSFYLEKLGPDYIEQVFRWAHEADPAARLFYNDYNAEEINPKSDAIFALLKRLKVKGVPLHGLGLQMHLALDQSLDLASVENNIKRFAKLGLDIHFSEVDIKIREPVTPDKLQAQAKLYGNIAQICLAAKECRAFVLWGISDKTSWIPRYFPGYGSATIFDARYQKKPAYESLKQALENYAE